MLELLEETEFLSGRTLGGNLGNQPAGSLQRPKVVSNTVRISAGARARPKNVTSSISPVNSRASSSSLEALLAAGSDSGERVGNVDAPGAAGSCSAAST